MTEQSNSGSQIRLPLILAITLAAGMFIGRLLPGADSNFRFLSKSQSGSGDVIEEILRYIDARYVDTVNIDHLKTEAINNMLDHLDPHTVYITPEELEAVEDDMNGGFEGIGIEFLVVDDTIQVVSPLSGGPSEAAGILAGDKVIYISDTLVAGVKIDNGQIFKKLRGTKGSVVQIKVLRGHEKELRSFSITRDVIPVKSVETAYMLDDQNGYVKINRFSARTYQEFMEAIQPMAEQKGMKNLILDLRGNPGGYLNEATDLLSQFFGEGKLLVYTQGRTEEKKEYKSNGRARFNIQNIAVLIDEGSASASEIVAGAIQDHDRGWIVGRRSFGKGLVQEQYPLGNGGALRLTISRYYTPSGRCIQRDYKHTDSDAYDHEAERRLKNGELSDGNKIQQADSTRYYTGLGRTVFGGGGITPDVFVPLDTAFVNDYYYGARQHLAQFTARFMEGRDKTAFPTDLTAFLRDFKVDNALFGQFTAYLDKEGVKQNEQQLARCRPELEVQLKARIAKILFQDEGLYRVLNNEDPVVSKALGILRNGQIVGDKK